MVYRYKEIEVDRSVKREFRVKYKVMFEQQGLLRGTDITRFARRGSVMYPYCFPTSPASRSGWPGLAIGSTGAVGDKDWAKAASSGCILSSEIAAIRRHQP